MFFLLIAMSGLSCPYPADQWVPIPFRRDMHKEAATAFGELADKNEPFNRTDLKTSLPSRRFVNARGYGCELILTYIRGGRGEILEESKMMFEDGHWIVEKYQ